MDTIHRVMDWPSSIDPRVFVPRRLGRPTMRPMLARVVLISSYSSPLTVTLPQGRSQRIVRMHPIAVSVDGKEC